MEKKAPVWGVGGHAAGFAIVGRKGLLMKVISV